MGRLDALGFRQGRGRGRGRGGAGRGVNGVVGRLGTVIRVVVVVVVRGVVVAVAVAVVVVGVVRRDGISGKSVMSS